MKSKARSETRLAAVRPTDGKLFQEVLRCLKGSLDRSEQIPAVRNTERWYERSYGVFAREEPWKKTPDGLVKVLAFASSWLPAIPEASPTTRQEDADALTAALKAVGDLVDAPQGDR